MRPFKLAQKGEMYLAQQGRTALTKHYFSLVRKPPKVCSLDSRITVVNQINMMPSGMLERIHVIFGCAKWDSLSRSGDVSVLSLSLALVPLLLKCIIDSDVHTLRKVVINQSEF